jgi:hypothetical protein
MRHLLRESARWILIMIYSGGVWVSRRVTGLALRGMKRLDESRRPGDPKVWGR